MSILDYLFYSVVGILVVFLTLILLMVIIKILTTVTTPKATPTANATTTPSSKTVAPPALAPGTAGEVMLYDTDPRDAAMIMAIVADELQLPLNELRFISIKEVKE